LTQKSLFIRLRAQAGKGKISDFVRDGSFWDLKELRVVLADDSELIRQLLQQALSNVEGLTLIGVAEDGAEAMTLARRCSPDLLILDIGMPYKNGIEVLKEIRRDNMSLLIVMFTAEPSAMIRDACLKAGADHFLDKSEIDALIGICRQKLLDG